MRAIATYIRKFLYNTITLNKQSDDGRSIGQATGHPVGGGPDGITSIDEKKVVAKFVRLILYPGGFQIGCGVGGEYK